MQGTLLLFIRSSANTVARRAPRTAVAGRQPRLNRLVLLLALVVLAGPAAARGLRPLHLVALGDSLTAGYMLSPASAFPAVLEQSLRARGHDVTVANAGVNGDTASGGYARLDSAVPDGTDGVILELGGNDMLQNVDPTVTRNALAGIIGRLKARGIPVLLAGMRALPSKGQSYVDRFEAIYPGLAHGYGLTYYPFFLQNVVYVRGLTQFDGIHPNAAGVQRIVQSIQPTVERFVARLQTRFRSTT